MEDEKGADNLGLILPGFVIFSTRQRSKLLVNYFHIANMVRTLSYCFLLAALVACKKTGGPPHPCSPVDPNCNHQTGNIIGKWILEASRTLSFRNPDPGWTAADCSRGVIIEFKNDSSFISIHHPILDSFYNRFSMTSQTTFTIYCSDSNVYVHPFNGQTISGKEIQLTNMGVDLSTQERYDCDQ